MGAGPARAGQDHRRGGGGVVPDLAFLLLVGAAVAGRRGLETDRGEDLPVIAGGGERALVVLARRALAPPAGAFQHVARVERHQDGRQVVARIAVGGVAPDGAEVADLRIGDLQRGLAQDRAGIGQRPGGDDFGLGGHRAEGDRAALDAHPAQGFDRAEVDQVSGLRHAQLHHRDQAVAPGDHQGLVPVLGKQPHRSGEIGRTVVVERSRNHPPLLLRFIRRRSWRCRGWRLLPRHGRRVVPGVPLGAISRTTHMSAANRVEVALCRIRVFPLSVS